MRKKSLCEMATMGTKVITHECNLTHWIHKNLSFPVKPNLCNSKTVAEPHAEILKYTIRTGKNNTFVLHALGFCPKLHGISIERACL